MDEALGYVFFVIMDFILIKKASQEQKRLKETAGDDKDEIQKIRVDIVTRVMVVAANVADFVIAVACIEPNPYCNNAVTLGISGLVSAWAGWYSSLPSQRIIETSSFTTIQELLSWHDG